MRGGKIGAAAGVPNKLLAGRGAACGFSRRWQALEAAPSQAGGTPTMLAIGAAGGSIGAIVGIGGGNVMMPLMTLFCKSLTQHQMSATSLVAVVGTGSTAAITFLWNGHVDPLAAALITASATATAPLGAASQAHISARRLRLILATFVCACAPLVPLKGYLLRTSAAGEGGEVSQHAGTATANLSNWSAASAAAVVVTGMLAGLFSGLLGIGGGVVLTPALALVSDLPQQTVLGTSLAAMVIPSLAGAMVHHRAGTIAWRAAVPLAIGASAGAAVGGQAASHLPEEELRWIFAGTMGALGAYMMRGALRARA